MSHVVEGLGTSPVGAVVSKALWPPLGLWRFRVDCCPAQKWRASDPAVPDSCFQQDTFGEVLQRRRVALLSPTLEDPLLLPLDPMIFCLVAALAGE
jgi:hypothetical protein